MKSVCWFFFNCFLFLLVVWSVIRGRITNAVLLVGLGFVIGRLRK